MIVIVLSGKEATDYVKQQGQLEVIAARAEKIVENLRIVADSLKKVTEK